MVRIPSGVCPALAVEFCQHQNGASEDCYAHLGQWIPLFTSISNIYRLAIHVFVAISAFLDGTDIAWLPMTLLCPFEPGQRQFEALLRYSCKLLDWCVRAKLIQLLLGPDLFQVLHFGHSVFNFSCSSFSLRLLIFCIFLSPISRLLVQPLSYSLRFHGLRAFKYQSFH